MGLEPQGTIPHLLFMAYQGTFAIITAALVSGAIVERMRFGAYLAFITLWSLVVYAPVAHWVWGGGFLAKMGALDFAGGTVVHINAATAAFVAAVVIGQRKDYARQAILPHNVPFTLLGAGLLWFGWFGFNAGSALAANGIAALAFVNTMLAPAGDARRLDGARPPPQRQGHRGRRRHRHRGRPRRDHARRPASSARCPRSSSAMLAAFPSYYALVYRARTRLDDSLDVVAAHGLGGTVGALLTGVFASKAWNGTVDGLLYGNPGQLGIQAIAVAAAIAYSGVASYLLLKVIGLVTPLKVDKREEGLGLDVSQHGEEAYADDEGADPDPATKRDRCAGRASRARRRGGGRRPLVKLVVAIVRPEKANDVLEALFRSDVQGVTLSRVQGHGGETEQVETYRGTTVKMELHEKVRFDIGVSDHFVEPTVKAILAAARTGEVGDGKVFVLPVEKIYRIRTGEEDRAAVTPVQVAAAGKA